VAGRTELGCSSFPIAKRKISRGALGEWLINGVDDHFDFLCVVGGSSSSEPPVDRFGSCTMKISFLPQ
jgi:hypothetical protein